MSRHYTDDIYFVIEIMQSPRVDFRQVLERQKKYFTIQGVKSTLCSKHEFVQG